MSTHTARPPAIERSSYRLWAQDRVRWNDHDGQNHVNNAVFATFFETGRVKYIRDAEHPLLAPGETFALARIEIDFRAELHFPQEVEIGLGVLEIGRRSWRFGQAIFTTAGCAATAEIVMVLMDLATRKAKPLGPPLLTWLEDLKV